MQQGDEKMKWLPKTIVLAITLALLLLSPGGFAYSAVQVSLPDTSAANGDTISIPIYVDDVTGLEIYSAEMTLTYDGSILEGNCNLTTTVGTIAESWGPPTCNTSSGNINIAMAGVSPLSGNGPLLYVAFVVSGTGGDTTTIHFQQMQFNEGDPPSSCQDGLFTVEGEAPVCDVSPTSLDFDTVCVGDSSDQTFTITNIGGGTLSGSISESCDDFDLVGSTTFDLGSGESAVFTVRFRPLSPGSKNCTIETGNDICIDVACSGEAEACAGVGISLPDTCAAPGDTILIPVFVDDVTGLEIYSAEMTLTYDGSILEGNCNLTTTVGTIAESWGPPTCNTSSGSINIAMAGVSPLSGSGVLVYVGFIVAASESTTIHFDQMQFNEGDPPCSSQDGIFCGGMIPPDCDVSPTSLDFGTVCVDDSSDQTFTITNIGGGTLSGSIIESCDDFDLIGSTTYDLGSGESAVFTVRFRPLSPGSKNCTIETGNDICIDVACSGEAEVGLPVKVIIPCCVGESGDTIYIPIWVDDVTGREIYSAEMTLTYDSNILEGNCDLTTTAGTIAESWGPPTCYSNSGSINIAMAGITPLSGSGALVYVAFIVNGVEGDTTTIHFDHMQFNEGDPPSSCRDGLFRVGSFIYGDINCDGDINGEDVICLLNYLYREGPPPCPLLAGDANCDGDVNGEDIIILLNYLYRYGPEPGC
jgi:hypothetical protein